MCYSYSTNNQNIGIVQDSKIKCKILLKNEAVDDASIIFSDKKKKILISSLMKYVDTYQGFRIKNGITVIEARRPNLDTVLKAYPQDDELSTTREIIRDQLCLQTEERCTSSEISPLRQNGVY